MKLIKADNKECILNYLIETDFGTFGAVEVGYGEESEMLIIKKDDEFAIANCIIYGSRGSWTYGEINIAGELCCYYTKENGELDIEKAKTEIEEVVQFICNMHDRASSGDDETYDIIYKYL